jgi:hypothetical protein
MSSDLKQVDHPPLTKEKATVNNMIQPEKPYLCCHQCRSMFQFCVRPNWMVRNLLFFLPVKVYFCARCVKNRYILITDKEEQRYHPV